MLFCIEAFFSGKRQIKEIYILIPNYSFDPIFIKSFLIKIRNNQKLKMSVSSAPLMNLELPSKPVQELIRTTPKQVPQKYIYQNKSTLNFSEIEYMETSTIDFNLLSSSSSNEQQQELQKLQSVLTSWGCFQLINHGLTTSLLDGIREVGKEFFALPLEMKERHKRTIDSFQGYGGDTVSDAQNYNWNDRLHLKVHPLQHRSFEFWPDYLPNFRETVEEYIIQVKKVVEMILKSIAKLLNLEENKMLNISGGNEEVNIYTRFNYYPPSPSADKVLGLKPHSDGTLLTVLLQDKQVEGLQVLKDNKWFKVPIIPDALFINLGDQLEIMSNGILKSVVHKVVIDKERARTSIATLFSPGPDIEIGPLTELIDDKERPRLYKNIKNYVDVFFQYYPKGERAINAMKI